MCRLSVARVACLQFDLDEHFASERLRLAQLTNKCNDDDLEYYVKESGEILGVTSQLMPNKYVVGMRCLLASLVSVCIPRWMCVTSGIAPA